MNFPQARGAAGEVTQSYRFRRRGKKDHTVGPRTTDAETFWKTGEPARTGLSREMWQRDECVRSARRKLKKARSERQDGFGAQRK